MRWTMILPLLLIGLNCTGSDTTTGKPASLDGIWLPVKQELGGKPLPPAAFASSRLVIRDSTYELTAESVDKGVLTYANGKMDIYGRDGVNAGKHFPAIYKNNNGELTICYNLGGGDYPESFTTKGDPMFFLSVFKKQE